MSADTSSASLDAAAVTPANGRAAVVVLCAFALFSGADVFVKLLAGHLPPPQVTFMITAIGLILLLGQALARGQLRRLVPREPKLALLRGMAQRILPGGLALVVSGCRVDAATQGPLLGDLLGGWQQYGDLHGMPTGAMSAIISNVTARQAEATTEEEYRRLMHDVASPAPW